MVKVSTVIIAVLLALSVVWSVMILVSPTMVLEGDSQAVAGKSYQDLMAPGAVAVALLYVRHMQVFALAAVIGGAFILFAAYRKGEKWAWWAMLTINVVVWGFGTAINLVISNYTDFIPFAVGLAVNLVALGIPIKSFFPAKA